MDHETELFKDPDISAILPEDSIPNEPSIQDATRINDAVLQPVSALKEEETTPEMEAFHCESGYILQERETDQGIIEESTDTDACCGEPYSTFCAANGSPSGLYSMPQRPVGQTSNPYESGYYQQSRPANPYGAEYERYSHDPYIHGYSGYGYPMSRRAPMPSRKKNRKPVVSLILGVLAMGVLNYFPFIALVLGLIAVCTAFAGLREDGIPTGQKVCGFIGLGLGIIALVISIAMLVMLLSLIIKVSNASVNSAGSIYR